VFSFASGKLRRSYDESPKAAAELQRHGGDALKLEPIDFGRRLAVERELIADAEVTQACLLVALYLPLHLEIVPCRES
jgi:peptidylprolyl isomerase domain and WD repeat-containing protein 1